MFRFLRKQKPSPVPLFEAALAASRNPVLYRDMGVPDTFDGRFDCLLLHLWPVFTALEGRGDDISQSLYDLTFRRMELALRESGVGDLGVGKQVRAMMKAFYGRLSAFAGCRDRNDWCTALRRNLYGTLPEEGFEVPEPMIDYTEKMAGTRVFLDATGGWQAIFPAL